MGGIKAMTVNNTEKKVVESQVGKRARVGPEELQCPIPWETQTARVPIQDAVAMSVGSFSCCGYQVSREK